MKNFNRNDYYKNDEEGFMIYLLSRLYNDLQINTALINSINSENNILTANAQIYLFKVLVSHLKEGLKILGIMKRSPKYNYILNNWINNNSIVKGKMNEVSDELEKPTNFPNSVNARFLDNIRNEVFHYCIQDTDDFEYYKECQGNLKEEKYDVYIELDALKKYSYEIGIDIPITKNVFTQEAINEVNELKNKIIELVKEILTDYYNNQAET